MADADDRPLNSLPDYSIGEIAFICRSECVGHRADVLFRRTGIALSGRLTESVVHEVGNVAMTALKKSPDWLATVLAAVRAEASSKHGHGYKGKVKNYEMII